MDDADLARMNDLARRLWETGHVIPSYTNMLGWDELSDEGKRPARELAALAGLVLLPEPERPTGDQVLGVSRNHHGDDWLTDEERAEEDEAVGVPFIAVGHNEPIPEHLPEEIKEILRESRRRAGVED